MCSKEFSESAEPQAPDFAQYIKNNQAEQEISNQEFFSESGIEVRARGSMITNLELGGQSILYASENKLAPKTRASHPMCPVGPSEGPGGQHGPFRYLNYERSFSKDGNLELVAASNELKSDRTYIRTDDSLMIRSEITNTTDHELGTSLGEHFYFETPDVLDSQSFDELAIDSKPLADIFAEDSEAKEKILAGEPFFIPGIFNEEQTHEITLPDKTIELSARSDDKGVDIGMLVWHFKDSNSICFEPVAGYDFATGKNDGISIQPGQNVTLETEIALAA